MYTLDDLDKAREALRQWEDRFDRYSGNNRDKYQSDIRAARRTMHMIEDVLKANGTLHLTEKEQLEKDLDAVFPDARSRQIVEHNGRRFQRRFWPSRALRVWPWGQT